MYSWKGAIFEGTFEEDRIKGEGVLRAGPYNLSGFFYSNGLAVEDAQNLHAVINYDNKDTYEGTVSVRGGVILREQGIYRFAGGDLAEGRFLDNA